MRKKVCFLLTPKNLYDDVTGISFRFHFGNVVTSMWPGDAGSHQIVANIFTKAVDIDVSQNSIWWPPPHKILTVCEFGIFRRYSSMVL